MIRKLKDALMAAAALLAVSFGLKWGFQQWTRRIRDRRSFEQAHRRYVREVRHELKGLRTADHSRLDACADKLFPELP